MRWKNEMLERLGYQRKEIEDTIWYFKKEGNIVYDIMFYLDTKK